MDPATITTILTEAGPLAAMLAILWWTFSTGLASQRLFHSNLISEMKEDRLALRAEMQEDRKTVQAGFQAIHEEIRDLRKVT